MKSANTNMETPEGGREGWRWKGGLGRKRKKRRRDSERWPRRSQKVAKKGGKVGNVGKGEAHEKREKGGSRKRGFRKTSSKHLKMTDEMQSQTCTFTRFELKACVRMIV